MYRNKTTGDLTFSPTDLTRFWKSEFVSWMDRYNIEFPNTYTKDPDDGMMRVLQDR